MADKFVFERPETQRIANAVRWSETERRRLRTRGRAPAFAPVVESFKNNAGTGNTAPAHAVMRVLGATTDADVDVLVTDITSTAVENLFVVNDFEEVEDQRFGRCHLPGQIVHVAYDAGTPAFGEVWGAKSGQWTATRNGLPLFEVLSIVDAAAKIMRARFTLPRSLLGKNLGSSIAANTAGPITVYAGTPGAEATAGFAALSTYNRTSTAIATDKFCGLSRINGYWYCFPWECP